MKKQKTIKPFYFNDISHQEMVDHLNQELPISTKYNEDLINRIHHRYPNINKASVALIVREVFQSFRAFLVLGKIMNFNNLFFDTKLHFFDYRKNGHILPSLKVKVSTPPKMRKDEL
jgi:hypothetical protein